MDTLEVKLKFRETYTYAYPTPEVSVTIEGEPKKVEAILKAVKEAAKTWEGWEER